MEQILKGISKKMIVTDNEVILKRSKGRETIIEISEIADVRYCEASFKRNGYIVIQTLNGNGTGINSLMSAMSHSQCIVIMMFQNEIANSIVSCLRSKITLPIQAENNSRDVAGQNIIYNTENKIKPTWGGLYCPKCRGTQVQLLNSSKNIKHEFQRTGLNLNPLHPLTIFKTKTIKKEKTSMAKVGLGFMTAGTSLLITGTKKKKHNEYHCQECGNRWIGK